MVEDRHFLELWRDGWAKKIFKKFGVVQNDSILVPLSVISCKLSICFRGFCQLICVPLERYYAEHSLKIRVRKLNSFKAHTQAEKILCL